MCRCSADVVSEMNNSLFSTIAFCNPMFIDPLPIMETKKNISDVIVWVTLKNLTLNGHHIKFTASKIIKTHKQKLYTLYIWSNLAILNFDPRLLEV